MLILRNFLLAMTLCLASLVAQATEKCSSEFLQSCQETARVVDSLRPEKPGQVRVFTLDGREFSAGQAFWMQRQMKRVNEACTRGDEKEAARLLATVRELLEAHVRT
jgi:hypothetical protein